MESASALSRFVRTDAERLALVRPLLTLSRVSVLAMVSRCARTGPSSSRASLGHPGRVPPTGPPEMLERRIQEHLRVVTGAGNSPGRAEESTRGESDSRTQNALQQATALRYGAADRIVIGCPAPLSSRGGRGSTGPGPLLHIYIPHRGMPSTATSDSAGSGPSGVSPPHCSWPRPAGVSRHAPCFSDDGGGDPTEFGRRRVGAGR